MKRFLMTCCALLVLLCCFAGCDSAPDSDESFYIAHARETLAAEPTEPLTEQPTEALTEKLTEAATEQPTEKPTEIIAGTEAASEDGESAERTYVLNTNTRKFHTPDCNSVKDIKDKNREDFTGSRDDLIGMGYSPCQRCKP